MATLRTESIVGGVKYVEERDAVTSVLLRRFRDDTDGQSVKARRRIELEDAIDDLQRMKFALDYAETKGDVAAPAIADGRALEAQLYTRMKSVFQEWRSA